MNQILAKQPVGQRASQGDQGDRGDYIEDANSIAGRRRGSSLELRVEHVGTKYLALVCAAPADDGLDVGPP